jgi:hypothetical protein
MSDSPFTRPEPLLPPSNLRIVLEHTRGPHKGLLQIMGTTAQFGGEVIPARTDAFTIQPGTRRGMAGLIRVTRRMTLYREIDSPDPGNFIDRSRQR